MIKPLSIDKNTEQHTALNFELIRSAGIALIQQMAGNSWTDYNLHDPGITILEQLCYGITDLAYRTDFPISDLLANEKGVIDYDKNSFFPKEEILTTNPVTVNDYRKAIIDEINEVENVWLYPVKPEYSKGALKGLYKVVVQVRREIAEKLLTQKDSADDIIKLVKECFSARRNLCEDIIAEIIILKPVQITIEADIQVSGQIMAEEVLANIYHQLENSLNLPVQYYSEKEMLEQGYDIDEIYSGPFLKKGFIPDKELSDRKTLVDPTELIKTVSHVNGVLSVKKLNIANNKGGKSNKPYELDEFSFPLLDIASSEQRIKLYRDNFELPVKRAVFRSILQKIREAEDRSFISSFYSASSKNAIKGKYRNNQHYHSIQNQFPRIYGIGPEGLINATPAPRKAQAKQLKAYLLFFEQIMANYLSQLAHINDVFSTDINKKGINTYYNIPLYDVPDVKALLKAFTSANPTMSESSWEAFKKDKYNPYRATLNRAVETDKTYIERKNRLLDHLFARFNEIITTYPVQLYSSLYELYPTNERSNAELKWKSAMLKNIAHLGAGRVRAFNYLKPESADDPYDFAWKMRLLLHINGDSNDRLTSVLNTGHITVDPSEKTSTPAVEITQSESDEVSWLGEMPNILIAQSDLDKLVSEGRVESADNLPQGVFQFNKQDPAFLKSALDVKNFRIAPEKGSGYIVLYKNPGDEKWKPVSHFSTHGSAMKSLKSLIDYIKNVNIKSEGFYLIEHILLRPDINGKNFGFRFKARNGQRLMEHTRWMAFEEREEVMESLFNLLSGDDEITPEKLAPLCRLNLYPVISDLPESYANNKSSEQENEFNYFKAYAAEKDKFLSRFEMVVRGDDNKMVNEDFFSLRMSVVLPSWPSRFQDKGFREAAEILFRLNSPAHIKLNFIWMNVTNLKRFEALYFDWRKSITDNVNKDIGNELRIALVEMLYKYEANEYL